MDRTPHGKIADGKIAVTQERGVPCPGLKEDDELHPKGYPDMLGQM